MSELMNKIMSFYERGEYFGLEEDEVGKLTQEHIETLGQVHRYLNGDGDIFVAYGIHVRVALFYLNHLVFNGCPLYERNPNGIGSIRCKGDVLVTHADATRGRCVKCGSEVSDYRA